MAYCNSVSARQCGRRHFGRLACEKDSDTLAAQIPGSLNPMGRGALFMLNSVPVMMIVGCALGFLAGLGVGGGSLLILWLSLVIGLEHNTARAINLLFFIPAAIIASFFRWHQGSLDIKKVLPAVISGCISAAFFSLFSKQIEIDLLRKFFGILLLITGIKEILYKPKINKKSD
jgi:uncharacterized membrane protein YfcA